MATAAVTYTFVPDTLIESAEANTNFNDLVSFLNNSVMHRDASAAFTAVPSGPATDPSTDNHLARYKWVLDRAPHTDATILTGTGGTSSSSSYTNFTGRLRVQNFVKRKDDTKLIVHTFADIQNDNALGANYLGVKVGAAATVDVCTSFGNYHTSLSGFTVITGVAAGTFDVETQFKVGSGSTTLTFRNGGKAGISVTETY